MGGLKGRRELVAGLFLLGVIGLAGTVEPRFFDPKSIDSILLWMPLITVAAMGQLLVILIRGIDVSIGSILGFSGIAIGLALRTNPNLATPWVFLLGAGVGLSLGLLNAVLIAYARISPIVVTIGTLTIFRGATFLLSKGDQIDSSVIPDRLTALSREGLNLGSVTVPHLLLIAFAAAGLTAFALGFTRTGRDIFAFGSNPEAAVLRGIPVRKLTILAYSISGLASGIAGVMYAARFGFVNPGSAGASFELNVIAAVAIGGVRITGGSGSVLGVLIGCLLLSCINVALSVSGVGADWQLLTYGCVIVVALMLDGAFAALGRKRVAA